MIKRNPAQAYAYEMLGKIYEDEKQYDRAVVNYEQALLLNPNQPGSYERMAEIFASQLKKPEKAIEVLNEARRRFPDLPGFAYLLARTLSMAKRHTEALAAFDMTRLEAEQSQESLLNGGFYFEWGAAAEQAGEYEKSVELFRKCLKIEDRPEVIAQASNYLGYMWVDRNENLEEASGAAGFSGRCRSRRTTARISTAWAGITFGWGSLDKALIELLRAVENTGAARRDRLRSLGRDIRQVEERAAGDQFLAEGPRAGAGQRQDHRETQRVEGEDPGGRSRACACSARRQPRSSEVGGMKAPRIDFVGHSSDVDWAALKTALKKDRFDNGRSAKELRESFQNSRHVCFAQVDGAGSSAPPDCFNGRRLQRLLDRCVGERPFSSSRRRLPPHRLAAERGPRPARLPADQ